MARSSVNHRRQKELLPILAHAFAELGYRRTTTAVLARRCNVRENVLYRLWPDKKAMFIAAVGHVYEQSLAIWTRLLAEGDDRRSAAELLLEYEARHHGEFGYYRIVFAGLSEADDPEIRSALARMYQHYQRFIRRHIAAHRADAGRAGVDEGLAAWAVVALGTVCSIGRELGLLSERQRTRVLAEIGRLLLNGPNRAATRALS